jgi:hypothetical protein
MRQERHAKVSWCADDIRTLRPDWSDEKCNEFLASQKYHIQCAMIQHGWDVIEDLLRWEESNADTED